MRVAVLDDDEKMLPYYVEEIASAFQHFGQEAQVKSYPDVQSCLEEKENIDIIFMDIKLPQDNGITVAEQLLERDSKLGVVFFSNYDSYVWESLRVRPLQFIRKDYFKEELSDAVRLCISYYQSQHQQLILNSGQQVHTFQVSEILYLEARGKYVVVHEREREESVRMSFRALEEQVKELPFVKIHRSYLVAVSAVASFQSEEVQLINGASLPLSKYRKEEAKKEYVRYL